MNKRDFRLVLLAAAFGLCNKFFLIPAFGAACPFLAWYFDDVLAGFMLLCVTRILLEWKELPPLTVPVGLLEVLLVGLFWEYGAPLYKSTAVADPWDLLAYQVGGLVAMLAGYLDTRKQK